MTKHVTLFSVPVILAAGAVCFGEVNHRDTKQSGGHTPPNIVWIMLDACRADNLSCYGYERETSPNMDKIAEAGVVFEENYAQATWTGISLPSYMTGRLFPTSCLDLSGLTFVRQRCAPEGERLLPEVLAECGYDTGLVATNGYIRSGARFWEAFRFAVSPQDDPELYYSPFEALYAEISGYLEEVPEKPFFLYVHSMDTHFPHRLEPGFDRWIDNEYESRLLDKNGRVKTGVTLDYEKNKLTHEDRRWLRGLYDGSILYADHYIGQIVAKLKSVGLYENTLVIIGADHGDALGEDGVTLEHGRDLTYDEVIHVPWVMSGPGIPPGTRVQELTGNLDIVPTLLGLAGLKPKLETDGEDLTSLIRAGRSETGKRYICGRFVVQGGRPYDDWPRFYVLDEKYQYQMDPWREEHSVSLWQRPVHVGMRLDVLAAASEISEKMRQLVMEKPAVSWKNFLNYPVLYLRCNLDAKIVGNKGIPRDAIVYQGTSAWKKDAEKDDDKWTCCDKGVYAFGCTESPKPITLRFRHLTKARYKLRLALRLDGQDTCPGSAVKVRVNEGPFQLVKAVPPPKYQNTYLWVDAGEHEINNGILTLTLGTADGEHTTFVHGFELLAEGARPSEVSDIATEKRALEQKEKLRALGYLD